MSTVDIGSDLRPDVAKFRSAVDEFIAQVEQAGQTAHQSIEALVKFHNLYASYCVLFLMHVTGHRPTVDPFCYRASLAQTFAIIEDKSITHRHACRAVIIPPLARAQIDHYRIHLQDLSLRLSVSVGWETISEAIGLTLSELADPPLPWFFLLSDKRTTSFRPKQLARVLDNWHWPLNAGRHIIATDLRKQGVPAELIALQMGHLLPEEQFCGPGSAWSLSVAEQSLAPALDRLTQVWGWRVLAGLQSVDSTAVAIRQSSSSSYSHGILGPEIRKAERARAVKEDRALVGEIIRIELKTSAFDQASLDRMAEHLHDASEGDPFRLARRLKFLWRWAVEERGTNNSLRLPERYHCLLPPPSPFTRVFPSLVNQAEHLRERFVSYLTDAGRKQCKPAGIVRYAEVIVSAALFGGLAIKDRLSALPGLIKNRAGSIADGISIDGPDRKNRPSWRWVPDEFTAALISSAFKMPKANTVAIRRAVRQLLRNLDPTADPREPFTYLANIASAYWHYRVPGFIAASLSDDTASQPLSVSTLVRLVRGVRLALEAPSELAIPDDDSILIRVGASGSRADGLALHKAIQELITRLKKRKAHGDARSKRNLKRTLREGLRKLIADAPETIPGIAILVAAWAIHLAERGTRWKKELAFLTVTRYIASISRPLIECASDLDFLNLSGPEFEATYLLALNYPKESQRSYLAGRLIEFHHFLLQKWGVDVPDWGVLQFEANARDNLSIVDANLLTPAEYDYALMLLWTDPHADARTRMLTSALLVLGYRFGPRVGDVLRLRYDDLEIWDDGERAVIHIATNIFGSPKSEAGIRQIPLLGTLNADEYRVLDSLKKYFDEYIRPKDPIAGLFSDPDSPRTPVERRLLLERVHLAIRIASGDPSLHFQHLRHGFGTRITTALFGDIGTSRSWSAIMRAFWGEQPDCEQVRRFLTGRSEVGESTLQALPILLGHAEVQTTLHHYVHIMDYLAQGIVNRTLPPLTAPAWSYALNEPLDTVRRRLARHKTKKTGCPYPPVSPAWPEPVSPLSAPIALGRPPAHLPGIPVASEKVTLELTDRILVTCALRNGKSAGLADRLLVSERLIDRILETARRLETGSRWLRIQVSNPSDWLFAGKSPGPLDLRVLKETPRVHQGLRDWQTRLDSLDEDKKKTLVAGLESWNASLLPAKRMSRFTQRSELERFLKVLDLLGIQQSAIRIDIRAPSGDPGIDPLMAYLQSQKITDIHVVAANQPPRVHLKFLPASTVFSLSSSLFRGLNIARVLLAAQY